MTTRLFGASGKQASSGEMLAALMAGACSGVPCSVWELTMIQQCVSLDFARWRSASPVLVVFGRGGDGVGLDLHG